MVAERTHQHMQQTGGMHWLHHHAGPQHPLTLPHHTSLVLTRFYHLSVFPIEKSQPSPSNATPRLMELLHACAVTHLCDVAQLLLDVAHNLHLRSVDQLNATLLQVARTFLRARV
eukprot:358404-Chlamydomonas_euryale.AAC.14